MCSVNFTQRKQRSSMAKSNMDWVTELMDASTNCVIGYEKYLRDKITSKELAKIMKKLYNILPMDMMPGDDDLDQKD